jgi:hypothetical protein
VRFPHPCPHIVRDALSLSGVLLCAAETSARTNKAGIQKKQVRLGSPTRLPHQAQLRDYCV